MFKIKNEQELTTLLKLISEEAVNYTKKKLSEDSFDANYQKLRAQEKSMFSENEEEVEGQEAEQPQDAAETETPEKEDEPKESPAPNADELSGGFVGSKDRLVDFVNDIRSAPSLKDSAVDEQVSTYYDRLSEEEKNVLVFFLRELSRVMTGKASGEEARDPSDPPLNIDFVPKEEQTQQPEEPADQPEESPAPDSQPETSGEGSPEEDTTPPIKVNESQDHTILRQKIRKLFI